MRFSKCKLYYILLIIIFLTLGSSSKGSDDGICGDVPLYLGRYTAPEVLLIVDLSGSMAYGLRPDWSPVYSPDADPDTNGTQYYQGFYTDHGLQDVVFNRIYWDGYFEIYPCANNIQDLLDDFLTSPYCYWYASPLSDFIDNCVDEILNNYGIVDWSYHTIFCVENCISDCKPLVVHQSPRLYEDDTFVLGNYLNTMRIEVVSRAIQNLVQDSSISFGLGFFKSSYVYWRNYTRIEIGIAPYSESHVNNLIAAINNIAHEPIDGCENCFRINVGGGTPFAPSIVAAKDYFLGHKKAEDGSTYSPGRCAKQFVIFLTDGIGNIYSSVENVKTYTRELVRAGVTPIAVGFNLPPDEDAQLRAMAEIANDEADGINTFALHQDLDNDGKPDPFIARNPQELEETLRNILYEIEQTSFISGSGATRKTQVGNMVIWSSFDVRDWTGELRTGYFKYNCANCHTPDKARQLARWNFFKDEDGDGHLDVVNEDIDGDGRLDTVYEDVDGDGHLDVNEDKNGNGKLDEGEDIDGDGKLDLVNEDLDGDGHLDVPEDIDGDGHLDQPEGTDWQALEEFLSDSSRVEAVMGSEALKGYSSEAISDVIEILKNPERNSEWWAIKNGWSTSETLSCDRASNRNIKYGTEMEAFSGAIGGLTAEEVAFIRGERACGEDDPIFRRRSRPLGDIIFSQPRIWNGLIWISANDGMLHAFDIDTGEEKFAYIPPSMLERYKEVGYWERGYCHAFLFDNTPVIQEVGERTVLMAGLGKGGSEYFALDISRAPENVSFMWNFEDKDLGLAINPAKIVRCSTEDWRVILTSGYENDPSTWANKTAYLYSIDLDNGTKVKKISLGDETSNMPSPPGIIDINGDLYLDYIYVGDLKGNVWRVKGCDLSSSVKLLELGENHPITAAPIVTTSNGMVWVFLGTGKYWDINDLTDSNSQYLIGFLDNPNTDNASIVLDPIETSVSGDYILPEECSQVHRGWKIELRPGERVISQPMIIGGVVFFLTFIPTGDECAGGGDTWLYAVDYNRGCASSPRLDINGDTVVDNRDKVNNKVPLAIYIGEGVPNSPPTVVGPNLLRVTTTGGTKDIIFNVRDIWIKPGSWTDVDIKFF